MTSILSVNADHKTIKGLKYDVLTGINYMMPSDSSGLMNACQYASDDCRRMCLDTSGHMMMPNVIAARQYRMDLFVNHHDTFMDRLDDEIGALYRRAKRAGKVAACRPNGLTDLRWERIRRRYDGATIMDMHPDVQFYDYTKVPISKRQTPSNYHLTFSYGGRGRADHALEALDAGINVAVVFNHKYELPQWVRIKGEEFPVVNGDDSDARFLDPQGVVVGLTAKGKARKDHGTFVVTGDEIYE